MRTKQVIYWLTTAILCGIMLYSASMYFTKTEVIKGFFETFNFPSYIVIPLAVLKLLGIAMIIWRKSKWLTEWAYAGFFFNLGFTPLIMLYMGAFNKKRIDLNASGLGNTQGTSAAQFLVMIPVMVMPMLIYFVVNKFVGFNAAVIAIALVGLLSFLLKKSIMNLIEKKYQQNKYATIHGFKQKD